MKTLEEIFCETHACDANQFRTIVLHDCLPTHARALAVFLGGPTGSFFEADRELIATVAKATNMEEVRAEIGDFFSHPANRRWLRTAAGIRLSTQRLKRLARKHLPTEARKPKLV